LTDIVNAPSPSGYEGPAARVFSEFLRPVAHSVRTDLHGNVIAALNPEAELRIMLAGHLDEIGFIVQAIDDDGYLYFAGIGDHDDAIALGQRVWVHGKERVPGVIGRKAIHQMEPEEQRKVPKMEDLWIDLGVESRAEAMDLVRPGDVATLQPEMQRLQGDRAAARGFDNKVGAYIVAEALRLLAEDGGLDSNVGVYAVGTVQEEIGYRGAITSSYSVRARVGLAVDVSHATDHPEAGGPKHMKVELGKGPTLTRGPYINPVVFDLMEAAAREEAIPYQIEVASDDTGTDASAMQVARGGMATGLVGIPLRYMHTPCEVLSLADVENAARLMAAFCRRVPADADFTPS
jgi:endoglucanase